MCLIYEKKVYLPVCLDGFTLAKYKTKIKYSNEIKSWASLYFFFCISTKYGSNDVFKLVKTQTANKYHWGKKWAL